MENEKNGKKHAQGYRSGPADNTRNNSKPKLRHLLQEKKLKGKMGWFVGKGPVSRSNTRPWVR
jgi:hypothetical protein